MQRIFKYSSIQNTDLTLDKELNILIERLPMDHMQELDFLKRCGFHWTVLYIMRT